MKLLYFKICNLAWPVNKKRVMIQLQILIQTYFVQADVALIHWLNENIK